jgi:hypothetical protein
MSFDFIVPINTYVYKAMSKDYDTSYFKSSWFTLNEEAKPYMQMFKTNKRHKVLLNTGIKLINMSSTIFHEDYMNKVLCSINDEKIRDILLLPIGVPDLEYQLETLKTVQNQAIIDFLQSKKTDIEKTPKPQSTKLFGNHHRLSINTFDNMFTDFVMKHYPSYNGIILPKNWPSCFHGYNFSSEVCIFAPSKDTQYVETQQVSTGGKKQTGGGVYDLVLNAKRYDQVWEIPDEYKYVLDHINDSINKPKTYT